MSAPACWGWKQCPERTDSRNACRCLMEAQQKGRLPRFGDFHEAAPLSKDERMKSGRKCKNYCVGML